MKEGEIMRIYRKRPIVIQAEQFQPEVKPWPQGVREDAESPTGYGIFTLEHTSRAHEVTPGDWIIIGVAGEVYACKADIFERTYDAIG